MPAEIVGVVPAIGSKRDSGAPGEIRTPDPLVRSVATELKILDENSKTFRKVLSHLKPHLVSIST